MSLSKPPYRSGLDQQHLDCQRWGHAIAAMGPTKLLEAHYIHSSCIPLAVVKGETGSIVNKITGLQYSRSNIENKQTLTTYSSEPLCVCERFV